MVRLDGPQIGDGFTPAPTAVTAPVLMNRGQYLDPSAGKVLVGDYARVWAAGLSHLKETTAERYRGIVRTHVEPRWGTYRLSSVATSDVAA